MRDRIDVVNYLLESDYGPRISEAAVGFPFIGRLFLVPAPPADFVPDEWWAKNPVLKGHSRSAYQNADYSQAYDVTNRTWEEYNRQNAHRLINPLIPKGIRL
jgi:hypothetical protein